MNSKYIHRYDGITDSNGEYITKGMYPVSIISYEGRYLNNVIRDFTIQEVDYATKFKIISFYYELNFNINYHIFPNYPFTMYYYPL